MSRLQLIPTLCFGAGLLSAASVPVTFTRDVAPVLQKHCQSCHRPGEAAPMSLLSYEQARPWAKSIKEAVATRRMPPWYADPSHGKFSNDRSLSIAERDVLIKWADSGAPQGDLKQLPAPVAFADGWAMGKPDVIFEMPKPVSVPAKGTIEYTYVKVPTNFTEDKWVQLSEARPGNRAIVHHIIAFVREPNSKWMKDVAYGEPFIPAAGSDANGEFLVGYAPGTVPEQLEPGRAKLIKAGSDIVFQLHYTANGKAGEDRSRVGLTFAKGPVTERVLTAASSNSKFIIPPGAPNHEVNSTITLQQEVTLTGLLPHMHLRGKDFEYRVVYPTGEKQTLLRVPRYDFNWQLSYYLAEPLKLPAGSKIECTAHFDNSPNNPANPDATKEVRYGDQSWEEMMIGFFDIAFDAKTEPADIFRKKKNKPASSDD